jgi:hypothetical protein
MTKRRNVKGRRSEPLPCTTSPKTELTKTYLKTSITF